MYTLIFFIGASIGSYLNCQEFRKTAPLLRGEKKSLCPKCKKQLAPLDLIPVFSYLCIGGKCRYCKEQIPRKYFWAEIKYGFLFLGVFIILTHVFL